MQNRLHDKAFFSGNVALVLIIINTAVFILTEMIPILRPYLSLNTVLIIRGRMYWQFISYMFVHGSLMHLLGNMLGLFFFGTDSGIAHITHLFGFAAAWVYVIIRMKKSPLRLWKEAYRT